MTSKVKLASRFLAVFYFVLFPLSTHALSGAIAQSYETNNADISQGALVSLAQKGGVSVTTADTDNASNLVGVAASQPLVELSQGSQNSVEVVVSGSVDALVTGLNGQIKAGDKITPSPISGIGEKATSSSQIVGTAQADLSSVKTVVKSFVGRDGKNVSAKVGLLPITVNVSYFSSGAIGSTSSFLPAFLQDTANALAGKAVSPFRVLAAIVALLLGFGAILTILSTAVSSGVISLGRNPLAASALRRGMADVMVTALGILVVTAAVVAVIIAT